jgi:hypothetical protein
MKISLAFGTGAIAVICNLGQSLAQTPLGFLPNTNNTLSVNFGNLSIAPGAYVPLQRMESYPLILVVKGQCADV